MQRHVDLLAGARGGWLRLRSSRARVACLGGVLERRMREENGSQQSDGLLIKRGVVCMCMCVCVCVPCAGEAKGDQRQDSGPSLNSANKPIQHSTSISWSTTVNTGLFFFSVLGCFTDEASSSSRWQKTASPEWTGRLDARRAPGGCQRPAAGRS